MALNHWLGLWGSPPISCLWWHPDATLHRQSTSACITLRTPQAHVIGLWFIPVYYSLYRSAAPLFITDKLYMSCSDCFPSKFALLPDCHWTKPRFSREHLPGVLHRPPALWNSFLKGACSLPSFLVIRELLIGFLWHDYRLLSGPTWTLCSFKKRLCLLMQIRSKP